MKRLVPLALLGVALAVVAATFVRRGCCDARLAHSVACGDTHCWFRCEFGLDDKTCAAIDRAQAKFAVDCTRHCREVAEARAALDKLPAAAAPEARAGAELALKAADAHCRAAREEHARKLAAMMPPEAGARYLEIVLPRLRALDHLGAPGRRQPMSTATEELPEISPDALRDGDRAAWDALARRWDKPLRAYLYRLSGDTHEADELASETLVRAWKARASITGGRLSTWLFAIATNLHRNRRRWWRRRLKWLAGYEEEFPEAREPSPSPDDSAMRDESAAGVRAAVLALPEELRGPLVLAVFEDKSQAEIGEILGLTVKAVEHRVARARERLRKTLG